MAAYRARKAGGHAPSIIINSVDNKNLIDWFKANELGLVTDFLAAEIERLARAGADFALIAANTPHLVFAELQQRARIPLLSIVETMKHRNNVDGLVLGGTELSLILREPTAAGLPILDTTQIHVDVAIEWMLRDLKCG